MKKHKHNFRPAWGYQTESERRAGLIPWECACGERTYYDERAEPIAPIAYERHLLSGNRWNHS